MNLAFEHGVASPRDAFASPVSKNGAEFVGSSDALASDEGVGANAPADVESHASPPLSAGANAPVDQSLSFDYRMIG